MIVHKNVLDLCHEIKKNTVQEPIYTDEILYISGC